MFLSLGELVLQQDPCIFNLFMFRPLYGYLFIEKSLQPLNLHNFTVLTRNWVILSLTGS